MSTDKAPILSRIFIALMIFSALVGICTVVFITSWPWEKKTPEWQPEFRLVALCGEQKEMCGVAYGELAEARRQGRVVGLEQPEAAGEVEEEQNWLIWKKIDGVYEVKSSSWHFQTTIRYTLDKINGQETPVIVAHQAVDVAKAFFYGIAAALFAMTGLYLRKLRN